MSDFPKEYAKPMKPSTGVILLWAIVLGICGLGMFVPALFSCGRQGYNPKSSCISRQKQIMTSMAMYSSDNDDYFPPYYSFDGVEKQKAFMVANRPYLRNDEMYICPVELGNVRENKQSSPSTEGIPGKIDFAHCLSLIGAIPDFSEGKRLLSESSVKDPAKTPYMRDVIRGYENKDGARFTSSHGSTFGVSYLDTHVKSVKLEVNKDL